MTTVVGLERRRPPNYARAARCDLADVPACEKGRTSDHVQTYVMRDVLWTAAKATSITIYSSLDNEARTMGSSAA